MFAKPKLLAIGAVLGLAGLMPSQAQAHRAWMLPSMTVLAGDSETVSVDAAISNELFVFEHHAMGLDHLAITGPDGEPVAPSIIGTGKYRSVFDVPLTKQGTYRIASANSGMMGFYELNGERKRWRGSADQVSQIPKGAQNLKLTRSNSRTETFVTLGAPNDTALAPTGEGLEMVPVTHPNDLVATEPAQMRFMLNGKPAADLKIEFVEGGTRYRNEAGVQNLTTDKDGLVTLEAPEAGMYFLEASARGEGAGASEPGWRASYSAVLEFLPL
ncbi:DUF4198 domain-containing protein [Altererythrobacter indicus]|uniref:DUF4198 domain-containing protein n=1 Tax=Altericroceibacterium indicum TaxID=374177 RepID=A0A845A886_9SPHN|nr:DUF4198 domain-containing protein [Altericroceibacterium indicum]MXP25045.1 DUF4198 domain-containing protein [Altericroceibacterium indicum]